MQIFPICSVASFRSVLEMCDFAFRSIWLLFAIVPRMDWKRKQKWRGRGGRKGSVWMYERRLNGTRAHAPLYACACVSVCLSKLCVMSKWKWWVLSRANLSYCCVRLLDRVWRFECAVSSPSYRLNFAPFRSWFCWPLSVAALLLFDVVCCFCAVTGLGGYGIRNSSMFIWLQISRQT